MVLKKWTKGQLKMYSLGNKKRKIIEIFYEIKRNDFDIIRSSICFWWEKVKEVKEKKKNNKRKSGKKKEEKKN